MLVIAVTSSTPQAETSQAATDVASVVLAAEGVFTELAQLSFSSVGSELTAAVEETVRRASRNLLPFRWESECCQ